MRLNRKSLTMGSSYFLKCLYDQIFRRTKKPMQKLTALVYIVLLIVSLLNVYSSYSGYYQNRLNQRLKRIR